MQVAELLLKILEDLLKAEFDTFKWYLKQDVLGNCKPIPRAHLEDASRTETVDKLLRSYGEETAVKITAEVLKRMKMNTAREELMRLFSAGEPDTNTTQMAVVSESQRSEYLLLSSIHRRKHAVIFLFLPLCSVPSCCNDSSGGERDHRSHHHGGHHLSLQYKHQHLNQPAATSRRLQQPGNTVLQKKNKQTKKTYIQ